MVEWTLKGCGTPARRHWLEQVQRDGAEEMGVSLSPTACLWEAPSYAQGEVALLCPTRPHRQTKFRV